MHQKRLLIILVVVLFLPVRDVCAQIDPLVGAALIKWGSSKLSDLLRQFRQEAEELIQDGANVGNALEVREGNVLNVFAENLHAAFLDVESKAFRDLGYETQLVIAQQLRIEDEIQQAKAYALDFKDSTFLDLYATLGRLPFIQEKFIVTSLRGLTQLQKSGGEYRFSFFASKLTPFDENQASSIQLFLAPAVSPGRTTNFVPIPPSRVTVGDTVAHRVDYYVPFNVLAPYFAADRLAMARGQFTIRIRTGRGRRTTDKEYTLPLTLAFLPLYAGQVTFSGQVDTYDWVDLQPPNNLGKAEQEGLDMDCNHREHDDCHNPDTQYYEFSLPRLDFHRSGTSILQGSRRYDEARVQLICEPAGPRIQHEPARDVWVSSGARSDPRLIHIPARDIVVHETCEWAVPNRTVTEQPDWGVVTAYTHNNSGPVHWTLTAPIQEYRYTRSTSLSLPVQSITYGKMLDIEVPDSASNVKMQVTTLDHRTFEVALGTADVTSTLLYVGPEATSHQTHIFHYSPQAPNLN